MKFKKIVSALLAIVLVTCAFPFYVFADTKPEAYSMSNGFINVDVSTKNGGFIIGTQTGNQLKKSDDNKRLLYHNGEYDTSFISFEVTIEGVKKEYIFGGKYGGLNDKSREGVAVTQPGGDNTDITAVWGTGDLLFTLTIALANASSNEHGMVSISVNVDNNGAKAASVKTRILYDTSLGDQDYGYYQLSDGTETTTYYRENVFESSLPQSFYVVDSREDVKVAAYCVNGTGVVPYRIEIGHWNNLASTLFSGFNPDKTFDFTDYLNEYMTADSACAMYYDLGSIASGEDASLTTFYGVFSNSTVSVDERVSINVTAKSRLELNSNKDGFEIDGPGLTNFKVGVSFENYEQEGAKKIDSASLVITSSNNLRPLNSETGEALTGYDYDSPDPLVLAYSNLEVGDVIDKGLNFQAKPTNSASFEYITVAVYDTSSTGGQIAQECCLGTRTIYILLPSSDGSLPKVGFVDMTPKEIYNSGTRHLYVSLTNSNMLTNRGYWDLYAENVITGVVIKLDNKQAKIKDNILDVVIGEETNLAEGSWILYIKWSDAAVSAEIVTDLYQVQTSSCLMFNVSNDPELKNETYGILSVVRFDVPTSGTKKEPKYIIKTFKDEDALKAYSTTSAMWMEGDPVTSSGDPVKFHSILLTMRGEFTVTESFVDDDGNTIPTKYSAVSTKSVDSATRKTTVSNRVTINTCLDFQDGTMSVYYNGSPKSHYAMDGADVRVEFDGELLTSDANTSVWKGKACFTEFTQGEAISLQPYKNNERDNDGRANETNIALVWPAAAGIGQTLAGMIFNLAFGEMGIVNDIHGNFVGYVVAFSAKLDLSFMGPQRDSSSTSSYWTQYLDFWKTYQPNSTIWGFMDTQSNFKEKMLNSDAMTRLDDERTEACASIMVPDILFGCGEGFYGVHFAVKVGIENYSEGLPKIEGMLEVNTIGDWGFGFEGEMDANVFKLEAKLSIKSHNNIPIPDEIYFYMGGFEPGFNIDGFGILWITGAGGGFKDLYNTVMCVQKIPPFKLIMTASLSILQVLDGTATISFGATGIEVEGKDIKILKTIDAIESIKAGFEWYPGVDFKASINVNLFNELIKGGGYIVVVGEDYTDWTAEMFLRARVCVPQDIPIAGGMTLAGVDMGINNEKIWGAVQIVSTEFGITYYWGSDGVDFGTGSKTEPSYPELLSYDDVPVYYDEERQQTLYMHIGTNIDEVVQTEIMGEEVEGMMLMSAAPYIRSDLTRTSHEFMLGVYNGRDYIVELSFDAASLKDAQDKAKTFTIKDESDNPFKLEMFDALKNNAASCNANLTYNEASGKATYAFTVTRDDDFNKVWKISTGAVYCDAVMYGLAPITSVSSVVTDKQVYDAGTNAVVTIGGINLYDGDIYLYTKYSNQGNTYRFSLCDTNSATDAGIELSLDESRIGDIYQENTSGSAVYIIPNNVPSGDYYVKCVYSDGDTVNGACFSSGTIHINNSNTPGDVSITSIKNAGDSQLALDMTLGANTDGVTAVIYEYSGGVYKEAMSGTSFSADNSGSLNINIGGSYTYNNQLVGLKAGKTYAVGITPYLNVDTDGNGVVDSSLKGNEVMSSNIVLAQASTADFKAETFVDNSTGDVVMTFGAIKQAGSSETEIVSGSWSLDGGNPFKGNYTDKSEIVVALDGLTDGEHTITLKGYDAQGDGYNYSHLFTVDTQAPKLVVSYPLNGALYTASRKMAVQLLTDADAILDISCDGVSILSGNAASIGSFDVATGLWTGEVTLPKDDNAASMNLTIKASDAVGNYTSRTSKVYKGGFAGLSSVTIAVDGLISANGSIAVSDTVPENHKLELIGILDDGSMVSLATLPDVYWRVQTVNGSANIDDAGNLTLSAGAAGTVTGNVEISTGAYMSYTLVLGKTSDSLELRINSTVGGTVSGAGEYNPGDMVTVTATPNSGYKFDGWKAEGVILADPSNPVQVIEMPLAGDVILTASFVSTSSGTIVTVSEHETKAIPSGVDANTYTAYYIDENGNTVYLPMTAVVNGKLVYESNGKTVKFMQRTAQFSDMKNWCRDKINFLYARGLVNGIGGDKFDPDGTMTRAMFVTVLYNLSGKPKASGNTEFKDVKAGKWYTDAVNWAEKIGLTGGYGNGLFGTDDPVTREEMCTFIVKYLRLMGYSIPQSTAKKFFADSDEFSSYAKAAIEACQKSGLISGVTEQLFMAKEFSTRAECCVLLANLIQAIVSNAK